VASQALTAWRGPRCDRLDELVAAHGAVGGIGPGRRTGTDQLNQALFLRLAAEFQGFCKELHAEAVDCIYTQAAASNQPLAEMLRSTLTLALKLHGFNASPSNLGSDFGRFGLNWWPDLTAADRRTPKRQKQLEFLNEARNGIAHDNQIKLAKLQAEGYRLRLADFKRCRMALDALAATMDRVLAAHLGRVFSQPVPW
jgi:hypothetical protein